MSKIQTKIVDHLPALRAFVVACTGSREMSDEALLAGLADVSAAPRPLNLLEVYNTVYIRVNSIRHARTTIIPQCHADSFESEWTEFNTLTRAQRAAVFLATVANFSISEIAIILNCSKYLIEYDIFYAFDQLAECADFTQSHSLRGKVSYTARPQAARPGLGREAVDPSLDALIAETARKASFRSGRSRSERNVAVEGALQ